MYPCSQVGEVFYVKLCYFLMTSIPTLNIKSLPSCSSNNGFKQWFLACRSIQQMAGAMKKKYTRNYKMAAFCSI